MELGTNFSAKLEPFLLMAKSVKGAAAAKLVQDATAAHGVLVFSELLEMPNIQDVRFVSLELSDCLHIVLEAIWMGCGIELSVK